MTDDGQRARMEISLNTPEKEETCLKTLAVCAAMADELADMPMAENITGAVALKAFSGMLNDMIEKVVDAD